MKKLAAAAVAAASLLVLSACSGTSGAGSADAPASKQLNVYAWAGEIPNSVVKAFEKKTGITVTVDTFDSNETMTAKLAAGNSGYDIVEPSQYAVQQLVGQGLAATIDYSKITSMGNIEAKFRNPTFDKGNAHSIPWIWGTTGLLYNESCTGAKIDSWKSMFDPKYKGKIYMLDNMLASYIVGLQVNGFKATSTDKAEVAKATKTLIAQKPLLAGYNATNYPSLVASGDACMAEAWGGASVAKVVAADPKVHYILPKEGGTTWVDNFSIVKDAPHTDAAYKWLNFTMQPDVAALATNDGSLATVNQAALSRITKKSLLDNPAIFAPAAQLPKSEFIIDPGKALQYFTSGWTQVKAS